MRSSHHRYIGYARSLAKNSDASDLQRELQHAGCQNVYIDVVGGNEDGFPKRILAMKDCRPGDTMIVPSFFSAAASLRDLEQLVLTLNEQGVRFKSLKEGFHTAGRKGRLLLKALTNYVRRRHTEHSVATKAGLEVAKARGRRGGRPRVMSPEVQSQIAQRINAKHQSVADIARELGVARSSIYAAGIRSRRDAGVGRRGTKK